MAVIGIGDTTPPTLESIEFTVSPSFIVSSNEDGFIEIVTSSYAVISRVEVQANLPEFLNATPQDTVTTADLRLIDTSDNTRAAGLSLIFGTNWSDNIDGSNESDIIFGFDGDDIIDGRSAADRMAGGLGNDTYIVDDIADIVIELTNEGNDTIRSSVSLTLRSNVENLALLDGGALNGDGNELNNIISGNSSNNILDGGSGQDTLNGANGNDMIRGGLGNDIITGGKGKDRLTGGGGSDRFRLPSLKDSLLGNFDIITDFAIGRDRFDGPRAVSKTSLKELGRASALTASSIGKVLIKSHFQSNRAATFSVGSRRFLGINDGRAGFQSNSDAVIELVKPSGNLTSLAII